AGGFWRVVFDVFRHHDLLPDARNCSDAVAATVFAAGSADGARCGAVAFGAECDYRDVRYVVPFLVQFWMFASPVAYPSSLVPAKWRWVYGLNPMAGVIEGFRWSLTGQGQLPMRLLFSSMAVTM